jgi:hypothetical protein
MDVHSIGALADCEHHLPKQHFSVLVDRRRLLWVGFTLCHLFAPG